MMSTDEIWNPTDLFKFNIPKYLKEKQAQEDIKQLKNFLQKQNSTVV